MLNLLPPARLCRANHSIHHHTLCNAIFPANQWRFRDPHAQRKVIQLTLPLVDVRKLHGLHIISTTGAVADTGASLTDLKSPLKRDRTKRPGQRRGRTGLADGG